MHLLTPETLVFFAVSGMLAGFLAGLLGIGGGVILVPLFLWTLPKVGFDPSVVVHSALGSSLGIIIPTALSSALAHRRRGNVLWHQVFWLAFGGAAGAILGASAAAALSGAWLKGLFGLMLTLVGAKMFSHQRALPPGHNTEVRRESLILVGLCGGGFSAFFGIGGGVVTVPLMVIFLQLPIHLAVGNASALIVISSLFGTLSYVAHGWGVPNLAPFSFGFVNLLVVLLVAPFSILFARLGVKVAGRLRHDKLLKVFAGLQIVIGVKLFISTFFL